MTGPKGKLDLAERECATLLGYLTAILERYMERKKAALAERERE